MPLILPGEFFGSRPARGVTRDRESGALSEAEALRDEVDLAGGIFGKAGNKPSPPNPGHPVLHGFRYIAETQIASAAAPYGAEKADGADEHEGENHE